MSGARKWLSAASLAAPAALLLFLSFRAGGFFPAQHALVALVFVAALVLRVTVAEHPLAGGSRLLVVAAAATALLAAWMLLSGSWSHAPGRALIEYDRALVYLLPLVLLGTVPREAYAPAWVVRWLALAIAIVCAAGLTTRLAPDVWSVPPSAVNDRLSYPLTYWNGLGITGAIGLVMLVHLTTSLREPRAIRVAAAALCPMVAATIYFTFSRGGIAGALIGIVVVLLVGRPAGLLTGLLPAAGASAVVVLSALDADVLSGPAFASPAGVAEGHDLALLIALAALGAAALRAVLLLVDARVTRWNERRPPMRLRTFAAGWAVAAAVGESRCSSRRARRASSSASTTGSSRATRPSSPISATACSTRATTGASTTGASRSTASAPSRCTARAPARTRSPGTATGRSPSRSLDGHSLYVESMGELGLVGLALVLVAVLTILFGFLRLARGAERGPPAALFAAGLIWALHAGIDWDWELTATGAWLWAAGGICLAAPAGAARLRSPGRVTRIVLGLCCLVLALTPFQILRSQAALDDAAAAFEARDCPRTIDRALASLSATRSRPEPYMLLGYCDTRLGLHDLAIRNFELAVDRDPDSWHTWYGLALARGAAGRDPRPAARRALELNPLDPLAAEAVEAFATSRPRVWQRRAFQLKVPES